MGKQSSETRFGSRGIWDQLEAVAVWRLLLVAERTFRSADLRSADPPGG